MSEQQEKIRFAVVGCGHIGKRHAEMITRNPESELVALADIRPDNQCSPNKYPVPFFDSIDALLQSGIPIDVVNIATPNGLHAAQALLALNAGMHVVIEKPMTLSAAEAQLIINKATALQKQVFVVMQNRYSPPSQWIKGLVNSGQLGTLYMVQLNCYWNRDERYYKQGGWHGTKDLDGGTLFTQFSHFIDMLYWLFGDIENINGRFNNFNHTGLTAFEDSGMLHFNFVKGGMGCLNFSTAVWDKNLESSITIIAENGSVKIGGQYMNEVEYCHLENYTAPVLLPVNAANDYGDYKGSAANHHYVIENVVDVLKGRVDITTTAAEGRKVVDIIERLYAVAGR
jgi:UDP-N-acetyl-2-amino-2-deoxyglucuronate dehydrogenase